jgi:phage baseplate assembly protein W
MATEKAISLPFSIDSFGKISTTTDQTKIWADKVRSVLGTSIRERVMRPTFGTLIPFSLFNSIENAVSEIEDEVRRAFSKQLQILSLLSVDIEQNNYTNDLKITVVYSLPNQEVVKTSIGYVSIQGTTPIYEELQ